MFRRRKTNETRRPLMPGRKTRRRMWWAYGWRAFVLIFVWGLIWTGIWWGFRLTYWRPVTFWGDFTYMVELSTLGMLYALPYSYWPARWLYLFHGFLPYYYYTAFILSILIYYLVLACVAAAFAFFCRKRERVTRGPFIVLLVILIVNSIGITIVKQREEQRLGTTPLLFAADHDLEDEVRELVASGADIHHMNAYGDTALTHAAANGNLELMEFLIANGAVVDPTTSAPPLIDAVYFEHAEAVEYLLDLGIVVHRPDFWGSDNAITNVGSSSVEIVEMLLEHGAHINETRFGRTPLEDALMWENDEVTELLIKRGADTTVIPSVLTRIRQWQESPGRNEMIAFIESVSATLAAGGYTVDATAVYSATAVHSATP